MTRKPLSARLPYRSARERRARREAINAIWIVFLVAIMFAGTILGAAAIDASRGISVSQSLDSAGL